MVQFSSMHAAMRAGRAGLVHWKFELSRAQPGSGTVWRTQVTWYRQFGIDFMRLKGVPHMARVALAAEHGQ
jgi:hypothetical protein